MIDAIEEREFPEDDLGEYPDGGSGWSAGEAGCCDCIFKGRKIAEAETEMNNVVGLRGCAPCVKEVDADVVAKCEELLQLARAGEITGIQCVTISCDGLAGLLRAGRISYSSIGMLHYAAHQSVVDIDKADA